jgi:UDP:flavonoid glycosyltransferase YjiC (YdhE family)
MRRGTTVQVFLFTTLPTNDLGLLARSLPIGHELAQRGHRVAFCSPAPAPSKVIAEAGFENLFPRHPLYHFMAVPSGFSGFLKAIRAGWREWGPRRFFGKLVDAVPTRFAAPTSEVWDADHLAALSGMMNARFVHANVEALKATISESGAGVVVDFWNPCACIAARALGKPLATVIQGDQHPASEGFIWWREPPRHVPTPVSALNQVLADYGLPPVSRTEELFVGDLTLVVGTPETDPLPEEAGVTYIGPVVWQKQGADLPDWWDELDDGKPLIWVYSGNPRYLPVRSPVDSAVVVQACIEALADEPVQVVLTTGHHALPRKFLPLPHNFRYAPFVPGMDMARRSDLLIHHGGYGSCQTGLTTGTPAVIIPTYSERESNARRVAALGAGEFLLPVEGPRGRKRVSAEELRGLVRRVLADPACAARASRVGEELAALGGAPEAARLIEGMAHGRVTTVA